MRLVGEFQTEEQAFKFQAFLKNHGMSSTYELKELGEAKAGYLLWAIDENDFDKAIVYYREWVKDPTSSQFREIEEGFSYKEMNLSKMPLTHTDWKVHPTPTRPQIVFSLTKMFVIICALLFIWSHFETQKMVKKEGEITLQYPFAPLYKKLLFDYPSYFNQIEAFFQINEIRSEDDLKQLPSKSQADFKEIITVPTWNGAIGMLLSQDWSLVDQIPQETLFGKIRKGEYWRLISPAFLHSGLLHILFNMAWLFMLGSQIEERIGKYRYLLLSLVLGIIGNVAQYLATGPIFLGYSGIITGLVGFIWIRQKIAPWEGYPLQKSVIVFITIFVISMLSLEILTMLLQFFHLVDIYANIANTAHITGGLVGVILGRLSFFARSSK